MALLLPAAFATKWIALLADNVFMDIDGPRLAALITDIKDSFAASMAAVNVPDWKPDTYYPAGFVILYSGTNTFYKAIEAGYLDAPDGPAGELQWEATLSPPGGQGLYQVGTVAALRLARGKWMPGRLYILNGRTDSGAPLDDVYVKALSAVALEPNGFTIDNSSLAAVPVPVRYDLATDETAPVAGGGPGDGYTKAEVNALLDEKGSEQVQAQHTLQLKTLGVQGSPVYGYLDGTDEPVGYASLDEALADPRQKTFFRFNKATIQLSVSNKPASPGWAYAADGEGCTIKLGADVRLSLPGFDRNSLSLEKFFVYQQDGKRGGRVKLLATDRAGITDGDLPFWQGGCNVPLELSGGAIGLQGPFTSFIGTGTIHLYEPYSYGYVGPNITLIEHKPGAGGAGTVKSVNGVLPDAAGNVVIATGGGSDTYAQLAFQPSPTLDLSLAAAQLLTLTNNVGFAGTSNRAQGRQVRVFLFNSTAAAVSLTFPSAWAFLGVKPGTLASGKKGVLTLECVYGSAEGDIVAGYVDQN